LPPHKRSGFQPQKNDESFQTQATRFCLEHAGLFALEDLDYVGF